MDRLPCSQRTQWSRWGKTEQVSPLQGKAGGHQGICETKECPLVPRDPVGSNTAAAAAPNTLNHSTSCSVSLGSHWLWEEGRALSTSEPGLGLGCGEWEWDSKTQLTQALSTHAFSSSGPWFNWWHLPRQQLSPTFPSSELGKVCMRNRGSNFPWQERSGKQRILCLVVRGVLFQVLLSGAHICILFAFHTSARYNPFPRL